MAILSTIKDTVDKRVEDERIRQAALQKAAAQQAASQQTSALQAAALQAAAAKQGASQGAVTGTTSVAPQPTGATGGNTGSTAYQQYLAAQDQRAELEAQRERNRIMTSGTTQERNALLEKEATQREIDRLNASGNTQAAAGMQQMMDAQQRAAVLSSGNQQQVNQYLMDQAKAQNNQNAYQAAVAAANPTTTVAPAPSVASQPAQMKNYTWYSWMGNNDMHTMNDEEKKKWANAMTGYQQGDYRAFNQDFQTAGNWGSYVDQNGNVSGMLRYAGDGIGGYLPVNNGKVIAGLDSRHDYLFYGPDGSVYTADANGNLTKSGNWTMMPSEIGPKAGYQDSDFWALNDAGEYQRYTNQTAPAEVLEAQGYYRDANGLVMPMSDQQRAMNALQAAPEVERNAYQTAIEQAQENAKNAVATGTAPSVSQLVQNTPQSVQPSVSSSGSTSRSSTTRETTPTTVTPTVTPQQPAATQPVQTQPTQNTQLAQIQPTQNTQPAQIQPTQNAPVPTQRGSVDYSAGGETPYQAAIDEWEYGPAPQWENTEYQRQRDEALRRAQNMRFSYDPESDPVWQAYQKQYRREGQRAMQDTMAEAAMRTGGLANSYAVSAASQAGNYYAAQLSDRLPQLYNDAYQRYLAEFQRQLGISDQYAGFDQTEYGRYADELGQWNKDRSFDYGLYRDRVGDARYADELAYDRAWNEENRDYTRNYQAQRDAINDQRYDQEWAQQLREYADAQNWKQKDWDQYLREYGDKLSEQEREWAYQQYRDAINDQRYDQEWAQQLREYADSQNWKAKDWGQYLREYEDKLSNQEREWAYQQYRDAVSDARYADETAYNRSKYEDETAYQRAMYDQEYAAEWDQNAWERDYKQTAYNDEMQRTALNYLNTNGIVTGRYAEILGVPDGTTYEQYYSRYLGNGGSTSPFEETEIDSGTKRTATPPSTPPAAPPEENREPETQRHADSGMGSQYVEGVRHENGTRMTQGFQKWWPTIRDAFDQGATIGEINNALSFLVAQNIIADYEEAVIRNKLGLSAGSSTKTAAPSKANGGR